MQSKMKYLEHLRSQGYSVFTQDQSPGSEEEEEAYCDLCEEQIEGPGYCCSTSVMLLYLHKKCAKLELEAEINHPLHPQHPLFLLPASPFPEGIAYCCNFCCKVCYGFVYHCMPCKFGLDIFCTFLHLSTSRKVPTIQHFSHQHPLFLVEKHKKFYGSCVACQKQLSGAIYRCLDCRDTDLHKKCAELPCEINHPFHPAHPLVLAAQSPSFVIRRGVHKTLCRFCHDLFAGFVYRCDSCNFDLDVDCALLPLSVAGNGNFHKLEHFSHEHPLILYEEYKKNANSHCFGCRKPIEGPFYRGVDCNSFDLHTRCVELPQEINHPYHRKHPLTLLPSLPIHPEKCSCYWCKTQYKGFIYYCSSCKFGLSPENVSLPRMITVPSHEHPWILLSTCISFICNFCGTDGVCAPYVCTICDLVVHKNCISLPQKIKITRHPHALSHTYFLQQNCSEKWEYCRVCHDEVNTEYGTYYCSDSGCNYVAHVKCAINGVSWDEASVLEDKGDERTNESVNLITDVIEEKSVGEDIIATEIKHAFHGHNLIMIFEVKDDVICNGCRRNVSLPFYCCEQCGFSLHRHCAELPRVKQHAIHKHSLKLSWDRFEISFCDACNRFHHGFSYICEKESCDFKIDIECSLLSDSFIHPSHEHILLLTHDYQGNCSGCSHKNELVYRCKEFCGFALGFECLTLPLTTCYKYDKHLLTLTYYDDSDRSQLYCDICEEERLPGNWFYYCSDCDNSVHPKCVLGDLPFIELESLHVSQKHIHFLKFVKKIWNCPRCHLCAKLCSGQALECPNSNCNRVFHFECIN